MMRRNYLLGLTLFLAAGLLTVAPAWATPYASAVRNSAGSTWEFVLNDTADTVTVKRDGANPVNFVAPTAGRYTFDMTGFSTFSIEVARNAPVAYTEIAPSTNTNLFTKYFRPNSIAVNNNPASPYFGTVYVANSVPTATASPVRAQGDGIYALTADLIGVDLVTKLAVADPQDTSQAKAPGGWLLGANGALSGTNSPYQMSLDAAGNLIVGDWSDANGGIKYAAPDLASGGLILARQDGVRPLLVNGSNQETHGSIASKPYTTGSVGNNLVVYALDEDFDLDGETLINATTGNHLWKWDVGNATDYDSPPSLVVSATAISTPVTDPGTLPTDAARQNYLNLNVGVDSKAIFSPQHNKWYYTQNRDDGNQAGLMVVTADGATGTTPTINWSSIQWSIDHLFDGNVLAADPTGTDATVNDNGKQDVFRGIGTPTISADGKTLFLHRRQVVANDTYVGQTSPLNGNLLAIPLDANGLPDIQINDNGTPANPADDILSNLKSITIANNNNNKGAHDITLDAAGNIYIGSNSSERVQVFSPGGNTLATTTSAGVFTLTTVAAGVAGDYNNNGTVDAADYVLWRNGGPLQNEVDVPGTVNAQDYVEWKARFGNTSGSGSALGAVPEPTSVLLAAMGLLWGAFGVRRRK